MRGAVLMLIALASGCCLLLGHDVRQFFTGRVVSTKPPVSALVGSYVVSVDQREGVTKPASVTLQLNADGTFRVDDDDTRVFADRHADGSSTWKLAEQGPDGVWGIEFTTESINGSSCTESWYVLQRDDGSYELGAFFDDPDLGHIVELRRASQPTTTPN